MKVVIFAAGENPRELFPWPFDRPKCLYSYRGRIQLERVIETVQTIAPQSDIRLVVGYRARQMRRFVRARGWTIEVVENPRYRASAIESFRVGLSGIDDDALLLMADELVTARNLRRMADASAGLVLLASTGYPYYNFAAFKLARNMLHHAVDARYTTPGFLLDVRDFLARSEVTLPEAERLNAAFFHDAVDPNLDISTGFALGWMMLDMVRCVGQLTTVERLLDGPLVTTLPIVTEEDYTKDLDSFALTDDYQRSVIKRAYMRLWEPSLRAYRATRRMARRRASAVAESGHVRSEP